MPAPHEIALSDQLSAAEADALQRLYDMEGDDAQVLSLPSLWIHGYVTEMNEAIRDRTGRICAHLGKSPAVMYTAVWSPTTLVCEDCTSVLALSDPERIRCYRCDKRKWPLNEGIARAGNVLMEFVICDPCAQITGLIPVEEEHHQ